MTVSAHQIHSVLRTYGQQLRRGFRMQRLKSAAGGEDLDKIKISSEAKRMQVIDRVSSEILLRMADPAAESTEVDEQILAALSEEYGQPLQMAFEEVSGQFQFSTIDPESGDVVGNLQQEESERLQSRLIQITKDTVDRTML